MDNKEIFNEISNVTNTEEELVNNVNSLFHKIFAEKTKIEIPEDSDVWVTVMSGDESECVRPKTIEKHGDDEPIVTFENNEGYEDYDALIYLPIGEKIDILNAIEEMFNE